MSADLTFTAAMVQMRTGLLPEPSLEQGARLIRKAAAQGAKENCPLSKALAAVKEITLETTFE